MDPLPTSFASTRVAVHTLAEHVLCAVRYAAVGRIGLSPVGDGIATPPFDGRVVGLRGVELVDTSRHGDRRSTLSTLRSAGAFFGVVPGAPPLWTPSTNGDPDATLDVEVSAVAALAAWFALVSTALATVHRSASQTLWPEHFDLAVTVAGATYGGSPGDATHSEPYLYITPPGDPVPDGDRQFWNEPFVASLSYDRITGAADAVGFLTEAMARMAAIPTEVGS
jgi:hypothetical protein